MATLQDTFCAGLRGIGATELPKHNRYTTFHIKLAHGQYAGASYYFFVGKRGTLRAGAKLSVAASHSCSDAVKARVASFADRAGIELDAL